MEGVCDYVIVCSVCWWCVRVQARLLLALCAMRAVSRAVVRVCVCVCVFWCVVVCVGVSERRASDRSAEETPCLLGVL